MGKGVLQKKIQGEIGRLLPKLNDLPINYNFKALPGVGDLVQFPDNIVKYHSTDQQNCYLLVEAFKSDC